MFGVKLSQVERMDARQESSQIRITDENRDLLASRFGVGKPNTEAPAPAQDAVTGQNIINDLYAHARHLQREYGASTARLLGCRSNDQDAIVHRLAEIANVKAATGHTIWEIASSHRTDTFSTKGWDKEAFQKGLSSVIQSNQAALSQPRETERSHSRPRDNQRATNGTHAEMSLEGENLIATTVIEPGGRLVKRIRDTIADTHGNTIITVERSRMNLGPLSFNLPGGEYHVTEGVPVDQAKEMAKDYIRASYRRK